MKKIAIVASFVLIGIFWVIYNTSKNTNRYREQQASTAAVSQQPPEKKPDTESQKEEVETDQKEEATNDQAGTQDYSDWSDNLSQETSPFPPPFVNKIGDITQRTIHVGVRQWEWFPVKLAADYGERVVLIMHNADVTHSISIPDLDVKQDIPDDGAVVQFTADKRGTFAFFCDTPCGKGHDQMRGEITIA